MNSAVKWPSTVTETGHQRKYLSWLLHSLQPSTPVVLVGSWARETRPADRRDIDILVLAADDHTRELALHAPSDVQVIVISKAAFEDRLRNGDDFPQWALRFGVPLHRKGEWEDLKRSLLERALWPDPERKVRQALEKRATAATLLEMGDASAAAEEARYAVSHIARALLLARRVFPLSRPELPHQLERVYQKSSHRTLALSVAESLRTLGGTRPPSPTILKRALQRVSQAAAVVSAGHREEL